VPKADSCAAAKPPYSVISSARKRTEGGMVSSRDFAVLRFITNWLDHE